MNMRRNCSAHCSAEPMCGGRRWPLRPTAAHPLYVGPVLSLTRKATGKDWGSFGKGVWLWGLESPAKYSFTRLRCPLLSSIAQFAAEFEALWQPCAQRFCKLPKRVERRSPMA